MSPMAYISNMKSPIGLLAREEGILQVVFCIIVSLSFSSSQFFDNWFGDGELLPSSNLIDCLASLFCINPATVGLCTEFVFIITGFDSEQVRQM